MLTELAHEEMSIPLGGSRSWLFPEEQKIELCQAQAFRAPDKPCSLKEDAQLATLHPFQQYLSHVRMEGDNERLCSMEPCLLLKKFLTPAEFKPGPLAWQTSL